VEAGIFAPRAAYDLERSIGWVERSTYTHTVRLVSTGSVLRRIAGQAVYGKLVTVTPKPMEDVGAHPIYRYGYAFPYPVEV